MMTEELIFSENEMLFSSKLNTKLKKYLLKTDINSVYQIFWVTYDILKISPDTNLDFDIKKTTTIISITNSNLTYLQIQLILDENIIEYEKISE